MAPPIVAEPFFVFSGVMRMRQYAKHAVRGLEIIR